MCARPSSIKGLKLWITIADDAEVFTAYMVHRWITFHSALESRLSDALIISGRTAETVARTITNI